MSSRPYTENESNFVPTPSELRMIYALRLENDRKMADYRPFNAEYEMKRFSDSFGYHWFDEDSKWFFRSKVGAIYHGESPADWNYFISSEQYEFRGQRDTRRYTVHQLHIDGSVETIGEFQQYSSSAQAKRAILKLLKRA